ncbi:MAG: AAA family ATPase [Chloroflexi bacterium]|nr:AAA family ATPase [Chloroflexota bacterium]
MLTRLHVQNYKSLRDTEVPLQPLTVLVGPNASGKSNILDCLAFLSQLTRDRLENAFGARGGYGDVVWGGDFSRAISVEFGGTLRAEGSKEPEPVTYGVAFRQEAPERQPEFMAERAALGRNGRELFRREGTAIEVPNISRSGLATAVSGLSHLVPQNSDLSSLRGMMQSWSFYDFHRPKIAERQRVKKETRLAPDGSNAATVLHWVRNADVETFNRIESLLKQALPEVEYLLTPPDEQGNVYIAFKEKKVPGRIPAWNISEGSARLVAVLLALFVPTPPALVAIESPESGLHPYLMEYLAEVLKLGSRETQIIITTHSPYLLNYLPPESLVIVTKEDGSTKAKRVKPSRALKEALRELGIGEMWHAGHFGGVP